MPIVLINKKLINEIIKIPRSILFSLIGIGIILALHFTFWISSIKYTSISSSVILVTTHPILVAPISHYFLKEKLSKINIMGIMLAFIGVIWLVYGNYGFTSVTIDTLGGNLLAISGGVAAGLYILGGRKIRKNLSVFSYAFVVYGVGTVTMLVICLIFKSPIHGFNLYDYKIIFAMAVISGILGHTLYNWSLEYIRASLASVALLIEPLFSTIFAIIIPQISQIPSQYTITGGCVILIGVYLTSRNKKITEL